MAKVTKKKEENMEEIAQLIVQYVAKVVQFFIEPKLQKHPKVNYCMESAMEQMINQMN
jgi:hypothetical protein